MGLFRLFRRLLRRDGELAIDPRKVEAVIGYRFVDVKLLIKSLRHRSYTQERYGNTDRSNERLEFLGDSVLNMTVAHYLFATHPDFQEGELTKLKSALVSKTSAALVAKKIGIDQFVLLSGSEEESGGRNRSSIVADTYEAIIGAIFLDGGFVAAQAFIERSLLDNIEAVLDDVEKNYKSLFLELTQSYKMGHPLYRTLHEDGPDHEKVFTVEVVVRGVPYGEGKGKSKKIAQQMAAKRGYDRLKKDMGGNAQS